MFYIKPLICDNVVIRTLGARNRRNIGLIFFYQISYPICKHFVYMILNRKCASYTVFL